MFRHHKKRDFITKKGTPNSIEFNINFPKICFNNKVIFYIFLLLLFLWKQNSLIYKYISQSHSPFHHSPKIKKIQMNNHHHHHRHTKKKNKNTKEENLEKQNENWCFFDSILKAPNSSSFPQYPESTVHRESLNKVFSVILLFILEKDKV